MTLSTSTKRGSAGIVILPPWESSSSLEEKRRIKSLVNSHVGQLGSRGKRLKYTNQTPSRDSLVYNPESYEYLRMHLNLAAYRVLKKDKTSNLDPEPSAFIHQGSKHSLLAPQPPRPVRRIDAAMCHPCICNCNEIRPRSAFEFGGLPMNATLSNLLHITKDWYISANWPLAAGVKARMYALEFWYETAREAMETPAHMHALLACASFYKARLLGHGNVEKPAIITAGIQHKLQSLKSLRQLLRQSKSQLTALQTILSLAAVEFYEGAIDNASMHLKAAIGMIDSLGGLQSIDATTRTIFMLGDVCVRWWMTEQSSCLITSFDEEDVIPEPWIKEMIERESSLNVIRNVHVDAKFRNTFFSNHGVDRVFRLANEAVIVRNLGREKTRNDDSATTEFLLWLHKRRCTIKQICLDGHMENRNSGQRSCSLESCAYLAIMICHGVIFYHDVKILVAHEPLVYFGECLERMLTSCKDSVWGFVRRSLYLWVCFVGAITEEIVNAYELKKSDWLATNEFLNLLDGCGLESINRIRTELQSFLYSGDELDHYLSVIVSKRFRAM